VSDGQTPGDSKDRAYAQRRAVKTVKIGAKVRQFAKIRRNRRKNKNGAFIVHRFTYTRSRVKTLSTPAHLVMRAGMGLMRRRDAIAEGLSIM